MNFQKMTKKQIDNHANKLGITLDGRKSKKDMIADFNKASKKNKPVAKKAVKKAPAYVAPNLSFWSKVKKYFNM